MPPPPTPDSIAPGTRRTEGVRTTGRSARVVETVLRATIEVLGRDGYDALRVDDVATISGVNKTTIYRRWPTKVELVGDAIRHFAAPPDHPQTGSLREDLLSLARTSAARAQSPIGCGIIRLLHESTHPEVHLVTRQVKEAHFVVRRAVVDGAIERGELPLGTDTELVVELIFSPIFRRIRDTHVPVDDAFIEASVDVVLAGARAGAAVRLPKRPAAKRAARDEAARKPARRN